ncbi:transketolase, partial [Suillus occidentalis]
IPIYPHLNVFIDGDTIVAFTENVEQRFVSHDWQVLCFDVNAHDLNAITGVIVAARTEKNKPTITCLQTMIGYGSKQQVIHGIHGS